MSCTHCQKDARRGRRFLAWFVPGSLLVLMPKCPACLAGYIALATGVGLSLPTAENLRLCLLVLCSASLFFLTIRFLLTRMRTPGA